MKTSIFYVQVWDFIKLTQVLFLLGGFLLYGLGAAAAARMGFARCSSDRCQNLRYHCHCGRHCCLHLVVLDDPRRGIKPGRLLTLLGSANIPGFFWLAELTTSLIVALMVILEVYYVGCNAHVT